MDYFIPDSATFIQELFSSIRLEDRRRLQDMLFRLSEMLIIRQPYQKGSSQFTYRSICRNPLFPSTRVALDPGGWVIKQATIEMPLEWTTVGEPELYHHPMDPHALIGAQCPNLFGGTYLEAVTI